MSKNKTPIFLRDPKQKIDKRKSRKVISRSTNKQKNMEQTRKKGRRKEEKKQEIKHRRREGKKKKRKTKLHPKNDDRKF